MQAACPHWGIGLLRNASTWSCGHFAVYNQWFLLTASENIQTFGNEFHRLGGDLVLNVYFKEQCSNFLKCTESDGEKEAGYSCLLSFLFIFKSFIFKTGLWLLEFGPHVQIRASASVLHTPPPAAPDVK